MGVEGKGHSGDKGKGCREKRRGEGGSEEKKTARFFSNHRRKFQTWSWKKTHFDGDASPAGPS